MNMSSRIVRGNVDRMIGPILGGARAAVPERAATVVRAEHPLQDVLVEEAIHHQTRQAHERGFQEGLAAAQARHQTEMVPLFDRLTPILSQFSEVRTRVRKESEEELVELAIAIARRILHRELTLDPEAVRGLVKVAFERVGSRELNRIRIHPAHQAMLRTMVEKACPNRTVELFADPAMSPGDVVFETERGDLDASVDSQLEEIRRGLADRLGA
jgi:flagellar assembly protein FliH